MSDDGPQWAPELGLVLSTHRRKLTSVATLVLLVLFCFSVVIALVVVALDQYETIEILKRLGMAALFLAGGGVLVWATYLTVLTRVDLTEKGFRHTYRGTVVVRWEDIRSVRIVRQGGYVKTLMVQVQEKELWIGSELSGFATIVRALKANGVMPRDFVE